MNKFSDFLIPFSVVLALLPFQMQNSISCHLFGFLPLQQSNKAIIVSD